ncbi:hypothetical protein, partial [Moraxella bovoculi]|uniref:hypothetical protein n=1 Tax=Moraxella bovoculi TaxID=386891 RepID=UPI001C2DAB75
LQLRLSASTLNSRIHHTKQRPCVSMIAELPSLIFIYLYPPPEVGGFTATGDKDDIGNFGKQISI